MKFPGAHTLNHKYLSNPKIAFKLSATRNLLVSLFKDYIRSQTALGHAEPKRVGYLFGVLSTLGVYYL